MEYRGTTEVFILSHEEAIKSKVDLNTLVPKLFIRNLLTPEEREEVLYEREFPHVRKTNLVTILSKKGETTPKLLIESLREETTHRPHAELADILECDLQPSSCDDQSEGAAVDPPSTSLASEVSDKPSEVESHQTTTGNPHSDPEHCSECTFSLTPPVTAEHSVRCLHTSCDAQSHEQQSVLDSSLPKRLNSENDGLVQELSKPSACSWFTPPVGTSLRSQIKYIMFGLCLYRVKEECPYILKQ